MQRHSLYALSPAAKAQQITLGFNNAQRIAAYLLALLFVLQTASAQIPGNESAPANETMPVPPVTAITPVHNQHGLEAWQGALLVLGAAVTAFVFICLTPCLRSVQCGDSCGNRRGYDPL